MAKRSISGVLLLDKPLGWSSAACVNKTRWLFNAQKAGHTGTLDPLATGVLPICIGSATRFSKFLLDSEKAYTAKIRLGCQTTTADLEGEVIASTPIHEVSKDKLLAVLAGLQGVREQSAPIYSALKYQGKPLYWWARKGIEVPIKHREIEITEISLLSSPIGVEWHGVSCLDFDIHVACSKGTYIRRLAEEIGEALGVPAVLAKLERTLVSGISLDRCISLEAVQMESPRESDAHVDLASIDWGNLDQLLLPIDALLPHIPQITLPNESIRSLRFGQKPVCSQACTAGIYRAYSELGKFEGMVERLPENLWRVIALVPSND